MGIANGMGRVNGMGIVIGRGMLCTLALACIVRMGFETRAVAAQSVESSGLEFPSDEAYLRLLVPGNESYRTLDGYRMKQLVAEQIAIARRHRDAGHQYWGRIIGAETDHETASWMAEQLRQVGADVRLERIDLPPQWVPRSWEVSASRPGEMATLASAWPTYASPGTPPDGIEVELIDIGLGMETDFRGRDVRGKAVIIHAMPRPGSISVQMSAALREAVGRANDRGAAAILVVVELPGNLQTALYRVNTSVPSLSLGSDDGATLQRMLSDADPNQPPRLRLRLDVEEVEGMTTASVVGVVPAATEDAERIVIVTHRDAFFDGASDNASGVATAIELIRYFSQVPRSQRRRTVEVIGTPGHHNRAGTGFRWLTENRDKVLQRVALLVNAEHSAHALVDHWGTALHPTNSLGPMTWNVNGSAELLEIANRSFDEFGIPRWAEMGGGGPSTGEISPLYTLAPSVSLMHAGILLHSSAETAEAIPAAGLAATARAYAKIIDGVNQLDFSQLVPKAANRQ